MAMPAGEPAPPAAAMNPPPIIAPPELRQSEPDTAPDADNGEKENTTMRARGRGAEHGSRAR
jgi:hypothetical protein